MISLLITIAMIVVSLKFVGFLLKVCGKLLGGIFGIIGYLLIGVFAVSVLGLAVMAIPIILIVGIIIVVGFAATKA